MAPEPSGPAGRYVTEAVCGGGRMPPVKADLVERVPVLRCARLEADGTHWLAVTLRPFGFL